MSDSIYEGRETRADDTYPRKLTSHKGQGWLKTKEDTDGKIQAFNYFLKSTITEIFQPAGSYYE